LKSKHLRDSTILITGGTGSFGTAMVKHLLHQDVAEIRIFSRDEAKQDSMRNSIKDSRLRFYLGDVRDIASLESPIKNSDYIFHAAALKQVPSCEFFPMQAVATNVYGSDNVLNVSYKHNVKSVVCLSTDKAVYPINSMGMTKALMEKVAQSYARNNSNSITKVAVTRYGNVMMSRGSVIPLFSEQIKMNKKITVTDSKMTRFMMSLSESVDLVTYAFENADSGDLFVKKAPGCTVQTIIEALREIFNKEVEIQNIGIRHGEKMEEALLGSEERSRAIEGEDYFRVPIDSRNLDYQIYFDQGQNSEISTSPFTSSNTKQLTVEEVIDIIHNLPEFQKYKEGI
jgi:UDP-N-acetylglucosamine 4,6-dehydratase